MSNREEDISKIPAPFRDLIPKGAELVKPGEEWKEGEHKIVEYKIATRCARCGYLDSIYNKHDYIKGEPQSRSVMWICMRCDNQNLFNYTVGKKQS